MKPLGYSKFLKKTFIIIPCVLFLSCATTVPYSEGTYGAKHGITSLEDIKINGLRHAVLIRGRNIDNPILLYIHSLGIPTMCFANDEYMSDTLKESKFTIVHYDQRGFGKTYRHGHHSKKRLTIDQYTSDAEELVKYLLSKYNKQKIYLMGESWGSVIGAKLAARHPEWFYAYIAVPQVSNVKEYLDYAYNYDLENAKKDNNLKALADLEKYGVPSSDFSQRKLNKSIGMTGKWMDYYNQKRYNGQDMTGYFFACLWKAPEYSLFDFTSTLNGFQKTSPKINKELIELNLIKEVPKLEVPVYMIIGEYDLMIESSKEFFDKVDAKNKVWLPVKNAGHMVRGEQYQVFDSLIYNRILPETYHK